MTRRTFLLTSTAAASALRAEAVPPSAYGPVPSPAQLAWSELEYYTFLHFTVNTFTNKEWGYGDEDPAIFNPTAFDADAIIDTLKAGGSRAVILTCKHHDGFCLWPTKTTDHCIKRSPYKGGNGDIVKEISESAHRAGLKFGIYVSPWDRNNADYGKPEYISIYRQQIRELLTGYGPVFEIWHDGANGGDGYYGGAREKRIIDKLRYYDWPHTWAMEHELQPQAVRFSDAGPDIRWVGNEKGIAGETCWGTFTPLSPNGGPGSPGDVRTGLSATGMRDGKSWMPAECDVSIRPGWFWHESENEKVKTPRELLNLYYDSVGRGASFLLNVPPDRRGLIHQNDAAALRGFQSLLTATFAHNLAVGADLHASNIRGNSPQYHPSNLIDNSRDTYWTTDDSITTPELTVTFPIETQINVLRLREDIRLGQRIEAFQVDVWTAAGWKPFGEGASVGSCRILHSTEPVTTRRLRLRITKSAVCPAICELGVFCEPA